MDKQEEIGFNIGWDYVVHGVILPEEECSPVLDGYKAARLRYGDRKRPAERPDRFVKKWLQLRRSAWKRSRIFSPLITPDTLREIDVPYCPVTRMTLTYGTGSDSDWSIDRLDNDGGYVPGNIVVMSTRANIIKDRLSYNDIEPHLVLSQSKHTAYFNQETADRLLGTTFSLEDRYRTLTLIGMQRATRFMLPATVHPPHAIVSNELYIGMSILALKSVISSIDKRFKQKLRHLDPSATGLMRLYREMASYVRDTRGDDLRELLNDFTTMNGIENLEVRAGIYWLSEDIWLPGSPLLEYVDRWFTSISRQRYEFLINGLISLSRKINITVNMDKMDSFIGRDTRGFIEAATPRTRSIGVEDQMEHAEVQTIQPMAHGK